MEKVLRSLIQETLPLELRVELDLLSRRRDLGAKAEKQQEILKLLRNYDIPNVVPLGPGTNRYAAKINGFVVKFATDHDGKIDNFKEFKVAKRFYPDVSRTHEVARNGSLLVAEYIPPFQSFSEMLQYADKIREKLAKIGSTYLIGDVGISSNNFANWGIRVGTDDPVCLDYAYAYEVSSSLFLCNACKSHAMMIPNKDFTEMHCPACKKRYTFEDIRGKIGNDLHNHEIGDLSEEGYVLTESKVLTPLDIQRSNYLVKKLNKNKKETEKNLDDLNDSLEEEFKDIEENKEDLEMNETQELVKRYMQTQNVNNPSPVAVTAVRKVDDGKKAQPVKPDIGRVTATVTGVKAIKEDPIPPSDTTVVTTIKSEVAFRGSIKQETDETTPVEVEKVEITPAQDEPHEEVEVDITQPDSDMYGLSHEFMSDMKKYISEVSNCMGEYMRHENLYDQIKPYIIDYGMTPKVFYKNTQNCIFRSLMIFFNFTEEEIPNKSGKGTHKEFNPPVDVPVNAVESLLFIQRLTTTEGIDITDPSVLETYHDIFDDIDGLQREWMHHLINRIKNKMPINKEGIIRMVEIIADDWCQEPDDEETETEEEQEEVIVEPDETATDWSQEPETEGDDRDEYRPENDVSYLVVDIYQDDDFDIVRVMSDDVFDDINIPFYTNLSELDIENHENIIDERNGHWEWLMAMVPDLLFRTTDPEPWLRINEEEPAENQAHIIILKNQGDEYIMGIFYIGGIYIVDEGVEVPRFDDDLLDRINMLVETSICSTSVSHLNRSLSEPDLIYPEEYISAFTVRDGEDNEDSVEEPDFEGSVVGDPMDDQPMSEIEKAGLRAAMNTLNAQVDIKEDEYEDETDVLAPLVAHTPEPDDKPGTFTPIRRYPAGR